MARYLGKIIALAPSRAMRAAITTAMADETLPAASDDAEKIRANGILAGTEMEPDAVRDLHAWFVSAVTALEDDDSTDDDPSALRAAYALLGGAEGRDWAAQAVAALDQIVEDASDASARAATRITARARGRVTAKSTDGRTQIILAGEIWHRDQFEDFAEKLTSAGDGDVLVRIASEGGDFRLALAMYNMLRTHPGEVVARIESEAASAASFVAMAANRVEILDNASMMIHRASGGTYDTADVLRDVAQELDDIDALMAGAYARGDESKREGMALAMAAETTYSAEEAVTAGLADTVIGAATAEPIPPVEDEEPDNADGGEGEGEGDAVDPPAEPAEPAAKDEDKETRAAKIVQICAVAGVDAKAADGYVRSGQSVSAIRTALAAKTTPVESPSGAQSSGVKARAPFNLKNWNARKRR